MSTVSVVNVKHPSSASNNLVLDNAGNATFAGTAAMASSFLRNRIINGAMVIDQRNAGAAINAANSNAFGVDRWIYFATQNGRFNIGQDLGGVTPPAGFTDYLGFSSVGATTVGAGDYFVVAQRIEGPNFSDLAWGTASAQPVTISFWVRSSLTGTFGGALANTNYTRSYAFTYTIAAANTWEYKTINVAGDTGGSWPVTTSSYLAVTFGLGVGSSTSGSAGSWQTATLNSATGAVSVASVSGATWFVTGVQLEVGSAATPFERRQYGQELALCQRYYEVGATVSYFGVAGVAQAQVTAPFKATKRATPTIALTSRNGQAQGALGITTNEFNINVAVANAYIDASWTAAAEL